MKIVIFLLNLAFIFLLLHLFVRLAAFLIRLLLKHAFIKIFVPRGESVHLNTAKHSHRQDIIDAEFEEVK